MEPFVYVVDTETSGEAPPQAGIVELASVPVTFDGRVMLSKGLRSYVNPGHRIPPDARGVHHISDEDVADAPRISTAIRKFKHLTAPKAIIAAHNMDFDLQFLDPLLAKDAVKLCTYRLARHLYPTAPNFKNQTLRYYLDCNPPKNSLKGMAPHGALYDSICTAFILARMIKERGLEELVDLAGKPVLLVTCHLKAHKGKPWAEVPRGYLQWILGADFDRDVVHTARHWLTEGRRPALAG